MGFEILHGAQVDIGGVVPLVGQCGRHWHAPLQAQVGADPPVTEVGEGNDRLATHAQHFVEDLIRAQYCLQSLGHYHVIEAVILEIAQPFVQILLQHVDAFFEAGRQVVLVDLQTITTDLFVLFQMGQQGAVSAAQVQQAGVRGDPVADQLQVITHGCLPPQGLRHFPPRWRPCACRRRTAWCIQGCPAGKRHAPWGCRFPHSSHRGRRGPGR